MLVSSVATIFAREWVLVIGDQSSVLGPSVLAVVPVAGSSSGAWGSRVRSRAGDTFENSGPAETAVDSMATPVEMDRGHATGPVHGVGEGRLLSNRSECAIEQTSVIGPIEQRQ